MGFCSFLMKAELGEAGKNLLIPRWQQLTGRILETKSCVFWKKLLAPLSSVELHGNSFGSFGIFLSFFV
jgi:hypothetical protein